MSFRAIRTHMARGDPRHERAVRVFTVCNESRVVVVRNVPALGVIDDLLKRLSLYGRICEYRVLDHPDDRARAGDGEDASSENEDPETRDHVERFTDVVWVQYETVNNARHAKARAVQKPFFGSVLRIAYAPQDESRHDTLLKLTQRRELLQRRAGMVVPMTASNVQRMQPPLPPLPPQDAVPQSQVPATIASTTANDQEEFIGPQLPPHGWRPAPAPAAPVAVSRPVAAAQRSVAAESESHKPKRRRI